MYSLEKYSTFSYILVLGRSARAYRKKDAKPRWG